MLTNTSGNTYAKILSPNDYIGYLPIAAIGIGGGTTMGLCEFKIREVTVNNVTGIGAYSYYVGNMTAPSEIVLFVKKEFVDVNESSYVPYAKYGWV